MAENSLGKKTGNQEPADWKRMAFKGNKVWMAVDDRQQTVEKNGKVLIRYQLDQDYEYWVHTSGVTPVSRMEKPTAANRGKGRRPSSPFASGESPTDDLTAGLPEDTIMVFTDGASSGNPGPAGIGVLLMYRGNEKCISRYIGQATNNIAELMAIQAGLQAIKNKKMPVRLFTDSGYAFGVLTQGWQARKNKELIDDIRSAMTAFCDLRLIKVKGHAGQAGNEKADQLATTAIKKALAEGEG